MISNPVKQNVNKYVERTGWVSLALESVVALVIGILLLVSPKYAILLIIILFGLFWLLYGLHLLLSLFRDRRGWGWRLAGGIGSVVVGLLLLAQPLGSAYLSSAAIIYLIAIAGMLIGIVMTIRGFAFAGWGPIVLGFLSLILGFLLVLGAPIASLVVPWLLGFGAIVAGGAGLLAAIRKRAARA